jgi:hypothetical protein
MQTYHQQIITRRPPSRRGYALVLVIVFNVLFLAIIGVAWRQMSSAIRTFSVRTDRIQQEQGALQALAHALRALEIGYPAEGVDYYDTVNFDIKNLIQTGNAAPYHYRIRYSRKIADETGDGKRVYEIKVEAVDSVGGTLLDPDAFAVEFLKP